MKMGGIKSHGIVHVGLPKYMLKRKIMSFNLQWPYVDFVPG